MERNWFQVSSKREGFIIFSNEKKNSSHLDETGNFSCLYSHRNSNLTGKQWMNDFLGS